MTSDQAHPITSRLPGIDLTGDDPTQRGPDRPHSDRGMSECSPFGPSPASPR